MVSNVEGAYAPGARPKERHPRRLTIARAAAGGQGALRNNCSPVLDEYGIEPSFWPVFSAFSR